MKRSQLFELQIKLLEELFPENWFNTTREKQHPAWIRWNLCKQILRQGTIIRYPDQEKDFNVIARMILDSLIFVTLTKGNLDNFILGSIDSYGDQAVQKKIKSRITDAYQFEDLMVELSFAAWHMSKKHTVFPWEKDNLPDIKIQLSNNDIPVVAECKNIRSASKNRINKVISKANSQIKAVSESNYGMVVLDISIPISVTEVTNDDLPEQIIEIITMVQSALSGSKNRSIKAAVLVWNDYMILGTPPEMTQIAFRRRNFKIRHKHLKYDYVEDTEIFDGYTVMYNLFWRKSEELPKEVVFTQQFRSEYENKLYIDIKSVIEVIKRYDRQESINFDNNKEIVILSRYFKIKNQVFTLVVFCEKQTQKLLVYSAFKIRDTLGDDIHLLSPLQLLTRFSSIYGLPITIGDLASKFIMAHKIPVKSTNPTQLIRIHNPENHSFTMNYLLKIERVGLKLYANCALVFCIDTEKYLKWISQS